MDAILKYLTKGLAWRSCPPSRLNVPLVASSEIPCSTIPKSFIEKGIQWPYWLSDSSVDDEDKEEVHKEGSDEGEAIDDEAIEDDDATPYVDTIEDVFTPAHPTTEGVVIREQSTPIVQTCNKRFGP
ncbi:hypothetical protein GOBAR_DD01586 [Gossypium barbadense]|nr:hypothetical protein GOBAR_DD01586 [Gossypium barbadense]